MLLYSLLALTSISQWALFTGIALILFGWIEKKEKFVIAGQVTFLLLGLLAAWILLTGQITIPALEENHIPKELKILAFYKGVIIFTAITVISLLLNFFKLRYQKVSLSIMIFFALLLFFMIFNAQQMVG